MAAAGLLGPELVFLNDHHITLIVGDIKCKVLFIQFFVGKDFYN